MKTLLIVIAVLAVGCLISCLQNVPSGSVGLIDNGSSTRLIDSGIHLRLPWSRAAVYPIEPTDVLITTSAETPGGTFAVEVDLRVTVDRKRVASIHRSYGPDYPETLIMPILSDYFRRSLDISGSYPEGPLRAAIEKGLVAVLNTSLGPYGIEIHDGTLQSLNLTVNERDARILELAELHGGKVVIIGSDGFDWRIYQEISKKTPMPNIERLREDGATGDLISIEPLVSPMIWTTMATGVEPQVHGIIDFLMKDASTGEDVPITSAMRGVPALWNMLSRFGLSAGFIGWLGTYPAEQVNGFIVSDRIVFHTFDPRWQRAEDHESLDDIAGLASPESLVYEIRPLILEYDDIGIEYLGRYIDVSPGEVKPEARTFDPLDPIRNLRLIIASNTTYEEIARFAYQKYRPELFSVYLDLVDAVCHLFIKHMAPHTPDVSDEEAEKYGQAVAMAYAHTDSIIGEWLDLIDAETTLILISDHGFKSGDIRPAGPSAVGGGQAVKWHRIAGAIALYGSKVKKGVAIRDANVLDVTPTVLRLLGLPAAKDMPGRVLDGALDDGWLASSAGIGEIETYGTRTAVAQAVRREDEEEAMLERLRALGYISGGATDIKRLATSHFHKGELDKAIEIWNAILSEGPGDVEIMTAIGNALLQKGETDQAVEVLNDAIEIDPDFLAAHNVLAICYINMNRLDDAAQISRSVLARDPRNPEAYFNLGVIFSQRNLHDQALSAFKRSVELRGDYDESRINLANEYFMRGSHRHAKLQVEKALELNPANPHGWYLLGRVYQGMRNSDSAMVCFRETLKRAPGFNLARVSLSAVLAAAGQFEDAKRELEQGLQYPYDLHMIHINLGIVSRQLGDFKAAEKHLKDAVKSDETYLAARFDLVDLYISQGEKKKARKELEDILSIDPVNDRAKLLAESLK